MFHVIFGGAPSSCPQRLSSSTDEELREELSGLLKETASCSSNLDSLTAKLRAQCALVYGDSGVEKDLSDFGPPSRGPAVLNNNEGGNNFNEHNSDAAESNRGLNISSHWVKMRSGCRTLSVARKLQEEKRAKSQNDSKAVLDTAKQYETGKLWEYYSGNTCEPEGLKRFGQEHEQGSTGMKWKLFKPPAWQEMENEHSSRARRRASTKSMPITDFLRSITTFQSVHSDDIFTLEKACTLQIFSSGEEILGRNKKSEFVYVIREGAVSVMKELPESMKADKVRLAVPSRFFLIV